MCIAEHMALLLLLLPHCCFTAAALPKAQWTCMTWLTLQLSS
jgi:hypothetical protein